MNSSDPLNPIRRAVGESVATIKKLVNAESKPDRTEYNRILRYEYLEDRRVLSVNGIEADPTQDAAYVTSDFEDIGFGLQEDAISHLKVLVNGEVRTLTPADRTLELVEGDIVEVVEIGFHSTEITGVFAAEGYVSKIGDLSSASLIDYNDGRFSGSERDALANGANGTIGGLANAWVVESGWDRLTVNLMHYDVDSTEVGARFFAQLQVGQPDFEFDTEHLDTILDQEIMVGDAVTIPAKWLNNVAGNFHNYAEVNIYHSSDTEVIVWAGATVGNASVDNSIGGEFLNTRESDSFSERWTPDAAGEYILKYYLDPEKIVNETNEDNNEYEIRLTVNNPAPIAVDNTFDAGGPLDVMENDISTLQPETVYANDFETDSLAWTTDPYGTDTATDGESESNVATVTVNVELKDFDVRSTATGDEDSAINLEISTEYDQVKVEGVPKDAVLSHGRSRGHGVYEVQASELDGLTILPAENSDADFRLTVTPAENGIYDESRTETINVVVNSVVDAGDIEFLDFGIVTGKSGKLPISGSFFDLDGSESHLITLNGLPDFVSLSAGKFDGMAWMLEASDLDGLRNHADPVADTSDWESYDKKNVFKGFEIRFAIESTKENGIESTFESGTFELFTIQKKKK